MAELQPVAPDLIDETCGVPHLVAGKSRADGRIVFPLPQGPAAAEFERVKLGRTGTLWSWTVQRFRPKTPPYAGDDAESFRPFAVGYVELAGQVIVESRLLVDDFSTLRIGMPMELAIEAFRAIGGRTVKTYAFRPNSGAMR